MVRGVMRKDIRWPDGGPHTFSLMRKVARRVIIIKVWRWHRTYGMPSGFYAKTQVSPVYIENSLPKTSKVIAKVTYHAINSGANDITSHSVSIFCAHVQFVFFMHTLIPGFIY